MCKQLKLSGAAYRRLKPTRKTF